MGCLVELSAISLLKRPRIRKDNLTHVASELNALVNFSRKKKAYSHRESDKGQATFLVKHSREQRVLVKASYTKNIPSRSWAAHGKYLQREHAQIEGKKGLGFDKISDEIDLRETLDSWQKLGDERLFKIILSPEGADQLNLQQHARELMHQVERDLGTQLQWIAIDHNNTENGHVHLLIRGIDENGQGLTLAPSYIAEGFRHRSQEIATLKLGLRTGRDMSLARTRQIEKSYMTELDRSILLRSVDGVVNFSTRIPKTALAKERRLQEIKRLKFLETLELSEKIGEKLWRVSSDLEKTLKAMQLSNDIIKSRAQHGLSISDYPDLLKPSELNTKIQISGKILGMNLQNPTPEIKSITPAHQVDSKAFIDLDRSIQIKSVNHIINFDTPIPYSSIERKRRLQEIQRLKFLETLGLAEKIGVKSWRLSEEMGNTLRSMAREQEKSNTLNANSSGLSPSVVTEESPITGKVVGVGLDDELHDRRYLLLEGTDGKVHYIRATESIVKARDQFKFKNKDIITLNKRSFKTEENEMVSFVQVNNHQSMDNILQQKISIVDDEVIRYAKLHQSPPNIHPMMSSFTQEFSKAMVLRFAEFEQQGLFLRLGDKIELPPDYLSRLDDIQHRRFGDFNVWQPHLDYKQKKLTLAGTVVASNERVLLMLDLRGKYYRVTNRSLGIDSPLKVGSEVYLRVHEIPKLEFTNTDKGLFKYFSDHAYSPKRHTQELMGQLSRDNFFLKDKKSVDSFVLAHQRRSDTWLKWGFVVLEAGVYKLSPQMAEKLKNERVSLEDAMKTHIEELKKKYEKAVEQKPCLFNVLTEKSINTDPKKMVLLDRILKEIGLAQKDDPTKIAVYLQARHDLWKSRGVEFKEENKDFEKDARLWFTESQTLEQVADRIQKPLTVIQEKSLQAYQGKVVSMGTLDKLDIPHLSIETEKSLLALPMSEKKLLQYKLNQEISLQYCYQIPKQKHNLLHKRELSPSIKMNEEQISGEN